MQFLARNEWWVFIPLASLTHLTFALNTVFFGDEKASLLNDSWWIHSLAKSYLETGSMTINGEYTLYQFTLYPFLISIFYKLFGVDPRWVLGFQISMSILFVSIFVKSTRRLLGSWRWLLGVCLCFDVHLLLYSTCLLTELWVALGWLIALWSLYNFQIKKSWLWWSVAISVLTIVANIKPLALFLPLFICFGLSLVNRESLLFRLKMIGLALVLYSLGMMPLLIRNYEISGKFPLFTTNSALGGWYYNIPYARSILEAKDVYEMRIDNVELMRQHLIAQGRQIEPISRDLALGRHSHRIALGLDEFEYSVVANQMIKKYLDEHFFEYTLLHIKSGFEIFTVSNLSWFKLAFEHYEAMSFNKVSANDLLAWWRNSDSQLWFFLTRIYELAFTGLCLGLAIIGFLIRSTQRKMDFFYWACWLIIIYVILVTGVNVWGRFRFLFLPILIFLAVDALKASSDLIVGLKRLGKDQR